MLGFLSVSKNVAAAVLAATIALGSVAYAENPPAVEQALADLNLYAAYNDRGNRNYDVYFQHSVADCVLTTEHYRIRVSNNAYGGGFFTEIDITYSELPLRAYDFSKSAFSGSQVKYVLTKGNEGLVSKGVFGKKDARVEYLADFAHHLITDGIRSSAWDGNRGFNPGTKVARSGFVDVAPEEAKLDLPEAITAFDRLVNACKAQ